MDLKEIQHILYGYIKSIRVWTGRPNTHGRGAWCWRWCGHTAPLHWLTCDALSDCWRLPCSQPYLRSHYDAQNEGHCQSNQDVRRHPHSQYDHHSQPQLYFHLLSCASGHLHWGAAQDGNVRLMGVLLSKRTHEL